MHTNLDTGCDSHPRKASKLYQKSRISAGQSPKKKTADDTMHRANETNPAAPHARRRDPRTGKLSLKVRHTSIWYNLIHPGMVAVSGCGLTAVRRWSWWTCLRLGGLRGWCGTNSAGVARGVDRGRVWC